MDYQKIFLSNYVQALQDKIDPNIYTKESFHYDMEFVRTKPDLRSNSLHLILPGSAEDFEFQNSKLIYENFKEMSLTMATDARIWTYLAHVTFWEYMRKRRPVENEPSDKRVDYIKQHWFIKSISASNLLRHDIAMLWWVAYLTYDDSKADPYELTQQVFTMLDYTRHLLPEQIGWSKNIRHALLEYVIENQVLFKEKKALKIRFLMRRLNFMAGYTLISTCSKEEIKTKLDEYGINSLTIEELEK